MGSGLVSIQASAEVTAPELVEVSAAAVLGLAWEPASVWVWAKASARVSVLDGG